MTVKHRNFYALFCVLRHGESAVSGSSMPFFMGRDLDNGIPTAREDIPPSSPRPGLLESGEGEDNAVPAGRAGTGMARGPKRQKIIKRKDVAL